MSNEANDHSSNGHIRINGLKGIWTLEEVLDLLSSNNLKVKIIISTSKPGDRESDEQIQVNPVVKEV
jgi:hypothetical protein